MSADAPLIVVAHDGAGAEHAMKLLMAAGALALAPQLVLMDTAARLLAHPDRDGWSCRWLTDPRLFGVAAVHYVATTAGADTPVPSTATPATRLALADFKQMLATHRHVVWAAVP